MRRFVSSARFARSQTNVKWPAREGFRSLDTTPFRFTALILSQPFKPLHDLGVFWF
jgi:hypothetical protein